jgi:hypothetical protein
MDAAQSALPDVTITPEEGDAFDLPPCEVCKGRGRRRATAPPCVHCEGTGVEPWSVEPLPPPDPVETEPVLHALKYLGLDLKDWRFAKGAGAPERRDAIRKEIRWQVGEGDRANLFRGDMAKALGISRQALHNIMVNNPTGRWK